ncbi:MAG: hypothetical protein Q9224_003245 [Gallowayella concinna]
MSVYHPASPRLVDVFYLKRPQNQELTTTKEDREALETMTTPSTTALVNGTPDRVPASSATSVDGEEDTFELNATRRHHLEQLAVPTIRIEPHWPSAASFNSSLDRLNDDADNVQYQQSVRRESRDVDRIESATQLDGVDGTSNNPPFHDNCRQETSPSHGRASATREVVIHQRITLDDHPDDANNMFPTAVSNPSSVRLNPTIPSPCHTPTPPPTSRQSQPTPSSNTPSNSPDHRTHHHRRRRLLRWLRRHLDHPLPWNPSLRRRARAQNVRRTILNVDRLLP